MIAGASKALSDEWIEAFCDLVLEWKVGWAEENGQISAGVGPALDKWQRERKAYCYRQQFPTRGDKAVRAQSIRGRMALDCLHVPAAEWFAEFKRELKPKQPEKLKVDSGYRPISLPEQPLDWLVF